jgi:very-short-patch-repair endonuclease
LSKIPLNYGGEGGGKRVGVKGLTGIAKRLRKHSTDTERHLWRHLRDRQIEGFKFRRQQAAGRYVVDFVNLEKKVVIELDGGQHALDPGDKIRDEWLKAEGYKVLRFWDNQVFSTPHPDPLPQGERGDNFLQYVMRTQDDAMLYPVRKPRCLPR